MKRRFSAQQLFTLRNHIPIDILIEKILMVPSKFSKGFFRFLCPLCTEFNTATNPDTNLARCFRCNKNFNTIDTVMIIRKTNFVESVKFLKQCQKSFWKKAGNCLDTTTVQLNADDFLCPDTKPNNCRKNTPENRRFSSSNTLQSPPRACKDPIPIGNIVHESLSHLSRKYYLNKTKVSITPAFETGLTKFHSKNPVMQRVERLKQEIENLSERLKQMETVIEVQKRSC